MELNIICKFSQIFQTEANFVIDFAFLPVNRAVVKGTSNPASILYKSIAGRYRPVSYPDGPITAAIDL